MDNKEANAPEKKSLKERALEEFKLYWIISLYLALFLGAFTVYRRLVLEESGIAYLHYGFAIVEALIIAKVILVGEAIGLGKRFERGPLIWSVLYKSVVFGVFVLLFGILERVVEAWIHKTGWAGVERGLTELGLYELLARVVMLMIALVPFFAVREIGRALGRKKLSELFFL